MGLHNKLDQSYRQAWMRPAFAKMSDWSNLRGMEDELTIESIRTALRKAMTKKGAKATSLSLQIGTNRTLVKDLLEKTDDVKLSTLTKLASALEISLQELVATPPVPVVGYIGAGGSVIFEDVGNEETVLRPPGISGTLIALMVRGSSMLPKYKDGDIIYIQREHDGILPDYVGEDCAVRLKGGETFIKQVIHGNQAGRFTLLSLNADPIENVEIEWATPVLFIMPARSRHLLS